MGDIIQIPKEQKKKGLTKNRVLPLGVHQKAYRFKILPTVEQKQKLAQNFGCARFIWNRMLGDCIEHYEETKKHRILTPAKFKGEFEWLGQSDSLALANVQLDLNQAFANFRNPNMNTGFPQFKKKSHYQSYTTNNQGNTIRLIGHGRNKFLKLPKLPYIQVIAHRELEGEIRSATIIKESSSDYFVSILCEVKIDCLPNTGSVIGLDVGLSNLVTISSGEKTPPLKSLRKSEKELARQQRKLSKKKTRLKRQNKRLSEAKNYQKQRIKVAKIHQKIANQRKDYLHKLSWNLIKNHDVIVIEDLAVKNLMKNRRLSKAIGDASWSKLKDQLAYKSRYYGRLLMRIDRWYPSSKTCSECGHINPKMDLSVRHWTCVECEYRHDRDVNAAINIKKEGIRLLSELPRAS